jgi:hypothetical protein
VVLVSQQYTDGSEDGAVFRNEEKLKRDSFRKERGKRQRFLASLGMTDLVEFEVK